MYLGVVLSPATRALNCFVCDPRVYTRGFMLITRYAGFDSFRYLFHGFTTHGFMFVTRYAGLMSDATQMILHQLAVG